MKVKAISVTALVSMIVAFPWILMKCRTVPIGHKVRLNPIDDNHLYDIDDFLS